jgi:O-antigen ligase
MTATSASGLAVSWSRGAVAGALVGVLVVLVMVSLKFAVRVGATTVAAIAGLWQVLPEETLRRLQDLLTLTTDNGERIYDARLAFWSSNFDFWTRHPLLGGSGVRLAPADSQYIGLLIGGGIVGIAVFLLVISVVLRRLVQIARNIEHPLRYAALGLTASVVAMLVNGISVPSFMEERVMEFFWFLVALIATPLASERFGEGISSE